MRKARFHASFPTRLGAEIRYASARARWFLRSCQSRSLECNAVPTPAVVTATDNCDTQVSVTYNEVKTPGLCLDAYTLTRTWTATDNCGNTAKCTQIITVQDTKAPVLVNVIYKRTD